MSDLKLSYHCRDSVTFSCEEGFAIIGSSTLTCQVDGTWDNTFPACVEKNCPELEEVKNAKTNFTMKGYYIYNIYILDLVSKPSSIIIVDFRAYESQDNLLSILIRIGTLEHIFIIICPKLYNTLIVLYE